MTRGNFLHLLGTLIYFFMNSSCIASKKSLSFRAISIAHSLCFCLYLSRLYFSLLKDIITGLRRGYSELSLALCLLLWTTFDVIWLFVSSFASDPYLLFAVCSASALELLRSVLPLSIISGSVRYEFKRASAGSVRCLRGFSLLNCDNEYVRSGLTVVRLRSSGSALNTVCCCELSWDVSWFADEFDCETCAEDTETLSGNELCNDSKRVRTGEEVRGGRSIWCEGDWRPERGMRMRDVSRESRLICREKGCSVEAVAGRTTLPRVSSRS